MKKRKLFLLIGLSCLFGIPGRTAEDADRARLKLPWEVLQGLLHIDDGKVTLTGEEFQALLARTGLKEAPRYTLEGGRVVLSREDFKRLVGGLLPPLESRPSVYLTKGEYRGRLQGDSAVVTAVLTGDARRTGKEALRVDLFPGGAAFQDVRLDGRTALVERENGRLFLRLEKDGPFSVEVAYSVPAPQAARAQRLDFPTARTPITVLHFILPEKNMDIQVSGALRAETLGQGAETRVKALLPPVDQMSLSWHPTAPATGDGPATVYADAAHLLSIEDDALRVQSVVNLQVLKNTVGGVTLEVPRGFSVLAVRGEAVGEWRETPESPSRLEIPFTHARKGSFSLSVTLEQVLAAAKSTATFTGLAVRGAVREKGFVAVELKTSAEVPEPGADGLERVDIRELPPEILALSNRPLLYAYKYLRPPFSLTLGLERHEDVSLLSSLIESAEGQSVLLKDGRRINRVVFRVARASKQFIEVALPAGARLWSAFVDDAPVKPSLGKDGKLLVPLSRSRRGRDAGGSFPVELVYYEAGAAPGLFGRADLQFPLTDMMVSRLGWSVYTPRDQVFGYWGRQLEKTDEPVPIPLTPMSPFPGEITLGMEMKKVSRSMKSLAANRRDENIMEENLLRGNTSEVLGGAGFPLPAVTQEMEPLQAAAGGKGAGVAGVLPVRVEVPLLGRPQRYVKTLPAKDVPMALPLYHVAAEVFALLEGLAFLLFLGVLYRARGHIAAKARRLVEWGRPLVARNIPRMSPFGWTVLSAFVSLAAAYGPPFFLALALAGFMAAAARWLLSLLKVKGDAS